MTAVARALLALAVAAPALAQDPALAAKLDRPTYVAVTAIVDSARVASCPRGRCSIARSKVPPKDRTGRDHRGSSPTF